MLNIRGCAADPGGVMGQMPEKRGVAHGQAAEGGSRLDGTVRRRVRARHCSLRTEQAYPGVNPSVHSCEGVPASL